MVWWHNGGGAEKGKHRREGAAAPRDGWATHHRAITPLPEAQSEVAKRLRAGLYAHGLIV